MEDFEEDVVVVVERAKPTPVSVADSLSARKTALRRFSEGNMPSIQELEKHAEKFGANQVLETAAELGYGLETLVRLADHCDRVDIEHYNKEHKYSKSSKKVSSEDRVKKLLGIEKEKDGEETEASSEDS
jgi:hypothetical protein